MFLILYQNQIITLKKNYKINSTWKKMSPKSVVLQSQKKLQILEKKIFQKKNSQLICVDMIFKAVCRNFFKQRVSRYLSLGHFKVPEIKISNKT